MHCHCHRSGHQRQGRFRAALPGRRKAGVAAGDKEQAVRILQYGKQARLQPREGGARSLQKKDGLLQACGSLPLQAADYATAGAGEGDVIRAQLTGHGRILRALQELPPAICRAKARAVSSRWSLSVRQRACHAPST